MVPLNIALPEGFLDEESRDGYLITSETKELWAIEIDLLKQFDDVCKKYGLQYCLAGGTLLGAVRHKGFIPWDDDIDVMMLRSEYDKLIYIASTAFCEPYFFQSAYTDNGYIRVHSQLRRSDTCGALKSELNNVLFNQGIFIDIFVLDYLPDEEKERVKHFKKIKMLKRIIKSNSYIDYSSLSTWKKLKKKCVRLVSSAFGGRLYFYKRLEKVARDVTKGKYVDNILLRNSIQDLVLVPSNTLDDVKTAQFEFLQFPIPELYDTILRCFYGDDYMKPIRQPNEHGSLIIDTSRSYMEIRKGLIRI